MAVSSSSTREFSVEDIVVSAARRAGIFGLDSARSGPQFTQLLQFGMSELDIVLDRVQGEATIVRAVERYPVTTAIGTAGYTLPSTTVDVVAWASYAEGSETSTTTLRGILRDEYMLISDKTVRGRPSLFFAEKSTSGITVQLWPVPSAVGTATFQRYRLLADSNNSASTVDLDRDWVDYLSWSLAHIFANASNLPVQERSYLNARAEDALKIAKRRGAQSWPSAMTMNYRSGMQR